MINAKELVFWQWDTNRVIHLNENNGYTISTVEFGRDGLDLFPFTPNRTGNVPTVKIPDEFFQTDCPFNIYLTTEDELGNRTIKKYLCNVKRKEKPSDYVYTPTEVKRFDDLEKRIIEIEGKVGDSVDLTPYRTSSDQDIIDYAQNDRIAALEEALEMILNGVMA